VVRGPNAGEQRARFHFNCTHAYHFNNSAASIGQHLYPHECIYMYLIKWLPCRPVPQQLVSSWGECESQKNVARLFPPSNSLVPRLPSLPCASVAEICKWQQRREQGRTTTVEYIFMYEGKGSLVQTRDPVRGLPFQINHLLAATL